mmetsp:Transcript_17430/g.17520  ORF Transcript_17430/g.17520 Transcript_17430/m.17520 type:complete len:377 (+) Transcript_17430:221-1351(+)
MDGFLLSDECHEEFKTRGIVVVPGVLTPDEVMRVRDEFHKSLIKHEVDVDNLQTTAHNLKSLSSTGGAGGILDTFYEDWKLKLNENPKIVSALCQLWQATYSSCRGIYEHPYGVFDPFKPYMYIDRVCFRVPDDISSLFSKGKRTLQRTLAPHLDCCPHRLYDHSESGKRHPKWRPIQAFLALTDTVNKDEGGLEACPGLHREFDEWVLRRAGDTSSGMSLRSKKQENQETEDLVSVSSSTSTSTSPSLLPLPPSPPCVGDFTPIRPVEDADILSRFEHIPCRAGDLVCWDVRIPHANSRYNLSSHAREVVYIGLLPGVPLNAQYAENQLDRYRKGLVPDDQWHEHEDKQNNSYVFSELGMKLMKIIPWENETEMR